jgi:Leucine-rich repeat (LRR) protein
MDILWEKAVEYLVTTFGQSAVDAWQQNSAVESNMKHLRDALLKAHLLIERSECWRSLPYTSIDMLLPQLKDAVYDAESIVNEFEYQRLKNECEESLPGIDFFRNWMNNFPNTVKMALDRLNNICNELKDTCKGHKIPENPNKFCEGARPPTSTFSNTEVVYGREKDLDEVISQMGIPKSGQTKRSRKRNPRYSDYGESSSGINKKGNVSVLSIVGMGGVGKTTLAQEVCNDKNVKSHFELILWVCVSDNFDLLNLTKEIIESAPGDYKRDVDNLTALQKTLEGILNSKRFLLVIDDVWSKDWQRLLAPMKGASEGSVVIVTTRSLTNVDSRGSVKFLEGLEEDAYWEFFKSCSFDDSVRSSNPELEIIGKEICGKLKGSPLAAKTIGGLLRTNIDARYWRNIKNSALWQLEQKEGDILPVLQLSYQYLPSKLKKCFSYCSLYPKDFKFTKWELTKLWIMQGFIDLQGFIKDQQQQRVYWEVPYIMEAERYFHELVQRCFFQKAAGSRKDEYVIHDLMHDVCQSITKDECLYVENEDLEQISSNIRHLSIIRKRLKVREASELNKCEKLLSLRAGNNYKIGLPVIEVWCEKLTRIRSLSLSKSRITELPESIGNLKHLLYLDISFTKIEEFPGSFCSLYNLLYLNMQGCFHIRDFPSGFNKLVNLCFLYLPSSETVIWIGNVEKLAKQIKIKDLFVRSDRKIENLKFLNELSGTLLIHGLKKVPSKQVAEEARLHFKEKINKLDLYWDTHVDLTRKISTNNVEEEVLEGLRPHHNLQILKISQYGGKNLSPSWLNEEFLPNLTEVEITGCVSDFTISQLPRSITKLLIWRCNALTNLQNSFGIFSRSKQRKNNFGPKHLPALKHLEVVGCEKLVLLIPVEELFEEFVFLEKLRIVDCPKLACPNGMVLPRSLKSLELKSCGELENSLPSCLQNLTSLEKLKISGCKNLASIPASITSNFKQNLSFLYVQDCANLQSIGEHGFLESVGRYYVRNCPQLENTGGQDINRTLPAGN